MLKLNSNKLIYVLIINLLINLLILYFLIPNVNTFDRNYLIILISVPFFINILIFICINKKYNVNYIKAISDMLFMPLLYFTFIYYLGVNIVAILFMLPR